MTLQEVFELNIFSIPPFHDLPFAKKEKLGAHMSAEILEHVAEEIAKSLPKEKVKEFVLLFHSPASSDARANFINKNIPDFEEILVRETLVYKEDFKKFMEERMKK